MNTIGKFKHFKNSVSVINVNKFGIFPSNFLTPSSSL